MYKRMCVCVIMYVYTLHIHKISHCSAVKLLYSISYPRLTFLRFRFWNLYLIIKEFNNTSNYNLYISLHTCNKCIYTVINVKQQKSRHTSQNSKTRILCTKYHISFKIL